MILNWYWVIWWSKFTVRGEIKRVLSSHRIWKWNGSDGAQDSSISAALLQTISRTNLGSECNSRLVRMWSRIRNINYHQILAHPLNEATTALCVKARRLFLILETHQHQLLWEDVGAAATHSKLWAANRCFLQEFVLYAVTREECRLKK